MTARLHPDDIDAIADAVAARLHSRRAPALARSYYGPRGTPAHQKMVDELVAGGASTSGFRRAVEKLFGSVFEEAPRVIPDAFYIRHDTRRIGIFEVTITHGITRRKLAALRAWRNWIAGHDWSLRVLEVNENGGIHGIDPEDGELDAESMQRAWDVIAGKIDP